MDRTALVVEPPGESGSESARLRTFLLEHVAEMELEGGSGTAPVIPRFDLYTQDYLTFAEGELDSYLLNKGGHMHLINCVSHLKRAIDCQLDTFLHVFNLLKIFRKWNLKFEKKLAFLELIGVFSSRSLRRLNTARNRMEHDFSVPKVGDIEVYFDLVGAFVAVLQRTITLTLSSQEFEIRGTEGERLGAFRIEYEFKGPTIKADWRLRDEKTEIRTSPSSSISEFAFFFRAWFALGLLETFASSRYVVDLLKAPAGKPDIKETTAASQPE